MIGVGTGGRMLIHPRRLIPVAAAGLLAVAAVRAADSVKALPIPSLGVQIEMPADAEPHVGKYNVFVWGKTSAACKVMLKDATRIPDTFENAVRDAQNAATGGAMKTWARKDQLPDGWALEWTYVSAF